MSFNISHHQVLSKLTSPNIDSSSVRVATENQRQCSEASSVQITQVPASSEMKIHVFGILLLFGAWMVLGAPASDPDKSAAIVEQLDTGDNKDLETAEWWGWGGWGWGGPWGGWGGPWGGWGGWWG
ncbi:hypothetical protein M8J77_018441 [Diaphorina citri]|nr:hypothetical protein M8J77_018441 [Diaphorina citri]